MLRTSANAEVLEIQNLAVLVDPLGNETIESVSAHAASRRFVPRRFNNACAEWWHSEDGIQHDDKPQIN